MSSLEYHQSLHEMHLIEVAMNKKLKEIFTAWLEDPELEGGDAYATLATLVSNLPIEMVNKVHFSLKGLLASIKGE